MENLTTVKLSHIKAAIESIEKHFQNEPERLEDIDVSFEYIIGSFFPDSWDKIQLALSQEHTKGYIEGYKDGAKEAVTIAQQQFEELTS